jgi:hypothetical protein
MSCDVAQYITLNDAPNQEAEAIVHESMFCLPRSSRRRATKSLSEYPGGAESDEGTGEM